MKRHPDFDTRRTSHSASYWYNELVKMRDVYINGPFQEWSEYGSLNALRTDIELLRQDLNNGEIQ